MVHVLTWDFKPLILCSPYVWMYLNYLYKPSNMLSAALYCIFTNGPRNGNHCSHNGKLCHTIVTGLQYAKFLVVRNNVLRSASSLKPCITFVYISRSTRSFEMAIGLFRSQSFSMLMNKVILLSTYKILLSQFVCWTMVMIMFLCLVWEIICQAFRGNSMALGVSLCYTYHNMTYAGKYLRLAAGEPYDSHGFILVLCPLYVISLCNLLDKMKLLLPGVVLYSGLLCICILILLLCRGDFSEGTQVGLPYFPLHWCSQCIVLWMYMFLEEIFFDHIFIILCSPSVFHCCYVLLSGTKIIVWFICGLIILFVTLSGLIIPQFGLT